MGFTRESTNRHFRQGAKVGAREKQREKLSERSRFSQEVDAKHIAKAPCFSGDRRVPGEPVEESEKKIIRKLQNRASS